MLKQNLLSKLVLLCAVLLGGASSAWADTTYKLTKVTSVEAGGLYVFEQDAHVMSNTISSSTKDALATTSTYSTDGLVGTESYVWSLETAKDGFYLKNVSLSSNQYLNNSSSTTISFGSKSSIWTISFTDGIALISNKSNSNRFLGYTSTSSYAYKAYATSNLSSYAHSITVYKLEEETSAPEPGTVAAPTFSPAAGEVAYGTTVTLTQNDASLIIYTTDGTEPSFENSVGNAYTTPIIIKGATTIKAIAVDDEGNESAVATAAYTVAAPAAPTFSPAGGKVVAGTTVTLTADVDMILYTIDGSTPSYENNVGEIYTTPIAISDACTLKAIAVDDGGNESEVATATFAIKVEGELTIDFEDAISSYAGDWEFVNINNINNAISAHGGSKYGANINSSGNGVASSTIATKEKIQYPGTLTCYLSKTSTNGAVSNWYVQVSSNGSTFENVDSHSASSMNKGTWEEFSVDLTSYHDVYVRILYDGGNSTAIRAIDDITLTVVTPKNVATPTFSVESGSFFETQNVTLTCETEGAEIYYTLDGTAPTKSSTKYTGAIAVSETTTIKAIAYKGSDDSNVASVTLTFPTVYNGIGELIAAGESGYLKLTNAQVYYVNGTNDIYIGDATGALDFYKTGLSYTAGQRLNGIAKVTYTLYNNMPEVKAVTENNWVASDGTPEAITKTVNAVTVADVNQLVEIVGTVGGTANSYYLADDDDNQVQFYDKFKVTTIADLVGKKVAAKGIVVIYNGEAEVAPISLDIVLGTKSVTIGETGYATFSHSAAVSFLGSGVTAYTVKVTDGVAKLTQIDKAPAGAAVVLEAEAGTYELSEIEEADALENNDLKVSDGTITGGESIFVLADGNNGVGFYRVAETVTIPAGKAYLQFSSGARSFIGFEGETTGIAQVEGEMLKVEGAYNLNGQRVAAPQKGLYIVNGKKVVIK